MDNIHRFNCSSHRVSTFLTGIYIIRCMNKSILYTIRFFLRPLIDKGFACFCKTANFVQAKAITDYRRLHGPIKSLQDLRLSKDFPPEAIERLLPYVAY